MTVGSQKAWLQPRDGGKGIGVEAGLGRAWRTKVRFGFYCGCEKK